MFIIIIWVTACIGALFYLLNRFNILCVDADVERKGLDVHDHGGIAIDYKQGYIAKDPESAYAMTVFGPSGGQTDESEAFGNVYNDEIYDSIDIQHSKNIQLKKNKKTNEYYFEKFNTNKDQKNIIIPKKYAFSL